MNIKIPGYTLHGNYYLADKIIPNKTWKEACAMKETVKLPNGKTVIAHTLSKKELETIPQNERIVNEKTNCRYWTNTKEGYTTAWFVGKYGNFDAEADFITSFGARLGFKNPFPKENKNTIKEEILETYNKCFNY